MLRKRLRSSSTQSIIERSTKSMIRKRLRENLRDSRCVQPSQCRKKLRCSFGEIAGLRQDFDRCELIGVWFRTKRQRAGSLWRCDVIEVIYNRQRRAWSVVLWQHSG